MSVRLETSQKEVEISIFDKWCMDNCECKKCRTKNPNCHCDKCSEMCKKAVESFSSPSEATVRKHTNPRFKKNYRRLNALKKKFSFNADDLGVLMHESVVGTNGK